MHIIMNKLLLIAVIVSFVACSSPENRAKKLVKQRLKETLHDWNSYENVKFGTLDSVYTTVFDNSEYVAIADEFTATARELSSLMDDYEIYRDLGYLFASKRKSVYDRIMERGNICDSLKFKMDSIKKVFIPVFKGWSIDHSFRANNLAGHKGIHHARYYFDKELTKIVDSKDIGENADE